MAKHQESPIILPKSANLDDIIRYRDLERGTIRLCSYIDAYTANSISTETAEILKFGCKKITLHITSPGGGVYASFAIYDILRELSKGGIKIEAIAEGYAASAAAAIVLQAADKRMCYPLTRFLLHEVRTWGEGLQRNSDLKDEAKEINACDEMVNKILADRCNKDIKEIRQLINRKEVWMSAKEALKFGLIDKIIT